MIFIQLDGDDVGPSLELLLLDEEIELARRYSSSIRHALESVRQTIAATWNADIFVMGGDDLAARLYCDSVEYDDIENLRNRFFAECGKTMSMGIGGSASEAAQNLRRAKLTGKNIIVSSFPFLNSVNHARA